MGDVGLVEIAQSARKKEIQRRRHLEVKPSEIILSLEATAGTISPKVLVPLVDFSLAIQSLSNQKDIPRISSQFVKACVHEILEMRENNFLFKEIDKRVRGMFHCLAILVSFPSELLKIEDHSKRKSFKKMFIDLYVLRKKNSSLSQKVKHEFDCFQNGVQLETGNYWQGILGETLAFILLKQAGFNPRLSTTEEDLRKIDIMCKKEEKEFPVQVKTNITNPDALFSVERDANSPLAKGLLLQINVDRFLRQQEMLKRLLSTNQQGAISVAEALKKEANTII